ncbi:lytic polysaccharide monooxygenase [Streptomyces sp. 4N509B]|uniref:lytic polysaccharide monooxygenase n=1 Tax=Streptomyces sp. 4N509B TaxID=3457413 RepID=UPI003FD044A9
MDHRPVARTRAVLSRAVTASALSGLLLAGTLAGDAGAHGATTSPPSRAYGCFERWGTDPDPAMEWRDPMCWQAWQANPTAVWDWGGVNRTGVGGDHRGAVPDGQLCSGGLARNGLYAAFDEPGPWHATVLPRRFLLTISDLVPHGAAYVQVYISRHGFDPTTERLGWDDLELVVMTGSYPGPGSGGVYQVEVDAGNRTGRHVVFTLWQAADRDETSYLCSDVIFE